MKRRLINSNQNEMGWSRFVQRGLYSLKWGQIVELYKIAEVLQSYDLQTADAVKYNGGGEGGGERNKRQEAPPLRCCGSDGADS